MGDGWSDGLRLMDGEALGDIDGDADGVPIGLADGVIEGTALGLTLREGAALGLKLVDGCADGMSVREQPSGMDTSNQISVALASLACEKV